MPVDILERRLDPEMDPAAISDLRRGLEGTPFTKLVTVVEQFGFSAEGTLSFLDQIRNALKNGDIVLNNSDENAGIVISAHELIAAPVDVDGIYIQEMPSPLMVTDITARNLTVQVLQPPTDSMEPKIRLLDPDPQVIPLYYLPEKPHSIFGYETNIPNLYLCQIFYNKNNELWCQERLLYITVPALKEFELSTPSTATQEVLDTHSPYKQGNLVLIAPPPPKHPEQN
jgi:hypothetical protein